MEKVTADVAEIMSGDGDDDDIVQGAEKYKNAQSPLAGSLCKKHGNQTIPIFDITRNINRSNTIHMRQDGSNIAYSKQDSQFLSAEDIASLLALCGNKRRCPQCQDCKKCSTS